MRHPNLNAFGSVWLTFAVLASGCSVITTLDGWTFEDDDAGSTHPGQMDAGRDAGRGRDAGPDCASGLTNCAGECTDLESSPEHCGACGSACSTPPNTVALCSDGNCGFDCALGFDDCNGDLDDGCEIEIASDPLNCGACAIVCETALSCREGTCRPKFLWAQRFVEVGFAAVSGLALDPEGNIYVTGIFQGIINLGGDDLSSLSRISMFVASYNVDGEHRWSRQRGGAIANAIAFDASGTAPTIHVTGSFAPTTSGYRQMLIATFDAATGGEVRSRGWGGESGSTAGQAIAVDSSGALYVIGSFRGVVDFGGVVLTSGEGSDDIFIVSYPPRYDATGHARWAKRPATAGVEQGFAIAMDTRGSVCVTGSFAGEASFGGDILRSEDSDVFLACFNASGEHRWSMRGGGTGSDVGRGIAMDAVGNVYITGDFSGSAAFGGATLEADGGGDVFLASCDSEGAHRWSRRAGGPNDDQGYAVAVAPSGSVYATGEFSQSANFGGGALASSAEAAFLVAHSATDGVHGASLVIGGPDGTAGASSAAAGGGLACLGGIFSGTLSIGDRTLIAVGSGDAFIACFEP